MHDEHMGRGRGGRAHEEDEQPAGLSVESLEFDDEDPDAPDAPISETVSGPGRPASRWSRIPLRHRVTAVTTVLVLAAGSVAAVQWDRAARRRAAEAFTLAVVDDRYQPAISEVGLDLGLTLVDRGPAQVTVVFLQVSQPGLKLAFYPVQVPLPVGKPTALTLVGVFDCQGTTSGHASTVEVTVDGQTGISSVDLALEPGSVPPDGWRQQRSAFCSAPGTGTGR
jgi:hypothetical protein